MCWDLSISFAIQKQGFGGNTKRRIDNMGFSVITDPVICVSMLDGVEMEMGFREIFSRAQEIKDICGESPLERYAVLRVLIAFAMDMLHRRRGRRGLPSASSAKPRQRLAPTAALRLRPLCTGYRSSSRALHLPHAASRYGTGYEPQLALSGLCRRAG